MQRTSAPPRPAGPGLCSWGTGAGRVLRPSALAQEEPQEEPRS